MKPDSSARRGYVRPMQGWWRRDAFFGRYMLREMTAFAVLGYALVLVTGLVRLAQGQAAWEGWLAALRSPGSLLMHAVLFVAMLVHTQSWFAIMPKTMPFLLLGGRRLAPTTITRAGYAAATLASLALLLLAWILRP
jgi:fumarate reductase subunit C